MQQNWNPSKVVPEKNFKTLSSSDKIPKKFNFSLKFTESYFCWKFTILRIYQWYFIIFMKTFSFKFSYVGMMSYRGDSNFDNIIMLRLNSRNGSIIVRVPNQT